MTAATAKTSPGRGPWTETVIEERINEAVDTLRRVPAPTMRRHLTSWPDYIHEAREAYGYSGFRPPRAAAAPDAITRLDETLGWLRWLPRDAQHILWSRASGLSWRKIARFAGKAPNTCRAWYLAALHYIANRLNSGADGNPPGSR
jgi:hypothetical protein